MAEKSGKSLFSSFIEYLLVILILGLIFVVIFSSTRNSTPDIENLPQNNSYTNNSAKPLGEWRTHPTKFMDSYKVAQESYAQSGTAKCDAIDSSSYRNHCKAVAASFMKDIGVCNSFSSEDIIIDGSLPGMSAATDMKAYDYCYYLYAIKTVTVSVCDSVSDSKFRKQCANYVMNLPVK